VTYDGCIKNHERNENFPTMNERVARELIRAFQQYLLSASFDQTTSTGGYFCAT